MEKLNIGQRVQLKQDMSVSGALSETPATIKKGTALFVGADKDFFYMLNGKMLKINEGEFEVYDDSSPAPQYQFTMIVDYLL